MKHSINISLAVSLFSTVFIMLSGDTLADTVSDSLITDTNFESAATLSYEELDENRGTFDPAINNYLLATNTGTNSGNTANNTYSGSNLISDGAFNSSSGVISVIQNSGNNVLIQSSTVVNVDMHQGELPQP